MAGQTTPVRCTSSSENPWTSERAGADLNNDARLDLVYYTDQSIVRLAREP